MPLPVLLLTLASMVAQPPARISVFTFSRDSLEGFADERLDTFRRSLGDHIKGFADLGYGLDSDVGVQLLGQGHLVVELREPTEPVRYHWTPDPSASRTWALVRAGDFSKEFSVEGKGARDMSQLAKDIATWLEENASTLREKRPRDRSP